MSLAEALHETVLAILSDPFKDAGLTIWAGGIAQSSPGQSRDGTSDSAPAWPKRGDYAVAQLRPRGGSADARWLARSPHWPVEDKSGSMRVQVLSHAPFRLGHDPEWKVNVAPTNDCGCQDRRGRNCWTRTVVRISILRKP